MKNYNLLLMLMIICALPSCQKPKETKKAKVETYESKTPVLKKYNKTSIASVLTYMDSAYYFEHIKDTEGLAYSAFGRFSQTDDDKAVCTYPKNVICLIEVNFSNYAYPCDSLMDNYGYDTTLANKDFLVFCKPGEPVLYQGKVDSHSVSVDNHLKKLYFDWLDGYITFKNDTINIEDE